MPVHNVADIALSSLNIVLVEAKRNYPACFRLLHPHSLLDTMRVLAVLGGGGGSIKDPGIEDSHCKLICSELSNVFKILGTPLE